MQISVIVPVYEQWHLIPKLVAAWAYQTGSVASELIIVDNGSDFVPVLPKTDGVVVLQCATPGSYAARNKGLDAATGELLVFIDADCIPKDDWLDVFVNSYQASDKQTILAGNVIIHSQNSKPSSAELYDIVSGIPQQRYVSKGYAVTANLAVPRIVLDTVGQFDGMRFSGGDAEFCQRANKAGFRLQFVPDAVVYHPARKTWEEYATKVRRMKGGQIRAGNYRRRLKYIFITLVPPVWRIHRLFKSPKLNFFEKLQVSFFQLRLWLVELTEMFLLLMGKTPERR